MEEPFMAEWFHKESLTSEEPFCFKIGFCSGNVYNKCFL